MADYVPGKDAVFDTWFSFPYQYVSRKCAEPAPERTHIPQAVVQAGPRMPGIVYRYGETGRKGSKPPEVQGARIYYGVFDAPPSEQEELPASVWAARRPHVITFRETDRGRRVYFALKWEIRKEHGESPWSEIQSERAP